MRASSHHLLLLLSGAVLALSVATASRDTIPILKAPEAFHEQLILKPLNDGSVYSHFQFTTHIGTMMDDEHFDGAASNLCKQSTPSLHGVVINWHERTRT